ncbi:hypothetical protein BAX97_16400 [Elizabethkingia meningoseptica]|uniref:hypothetical protein n=1 Tax=Elizabethkingia meningoseptica TaxID=238 RepID=UPI000332C30B|nr:hypothetical protein [Elizabethkingia meningoseptica]AQX05077.1 hypothetical protein BBD33_07370 [Elizabethkingia meningoseptica]AQX47121.1 hypothetical protein B5G46_07360 [Elizabethkingia meningoseptica]EJK5329407.1 hypothetical protein [Elizabethkingia meningoseptica]EOR30578.1 hypothetical protein L100_05601 [Elizabethkingia meningoseptica ATCC 13253 = NBRC 12535]KUY17905.1 hypothetical protein ATB99_06535 [Elizabethkingia meningoseptica]
MKKLLFMAIGLIGGLTFAQVSTGELNGIKLHMTVAELNQKFNQHITPKVTDNFTDEPQNYTPVKINGVQYNILFVKSEYDPKVAVYSIATTDAKSKGKSPVGIGSTLADLKKAYAKESTDLTKNRFTVYQKNTGEQILIFELKNNKVARIFVSVFAAG